MCSTNSAVAKIGGSYSEFGLADFTGIAEATFGTFDSGCEDQDAVAKAGGSCSEYGLADASKVADFTFNAFNPWRRR